jgi:hypothetical protein
MFKNAIFILLCLTAPLLNAQQSLSEEQIRLQKDSLKYKALIPAKYQLNAAIHGDLNQDGQADLVLIVKQTDPNQWVINHFDEKVDRNRRGIMVFLHQNGKYQKLLQNLDCFSSENEDGGVYFAPELFFEIKKNLMKVNYGHGRYGYWNYTFRLQGQDLRLIGYNQSENHGPYTDYFTSINFLTQKKLFKENMNLENRDQPERFKETWSKISQKPIYLSQIKDFDELTFE